MACGENKPACLTARKIVDAAYLLTSMTGAALVASNIGAQFWGYLLFLVSSICGIYLVWNSNASRSLLWVNAMFAVINVFGLIRA